MKKLALTLAIVMVLSCFLFACTGSGEDEATTTTTTTTTTTMTKTEGGEPDTDGGNTDDGNTDDGNTDDGNTDDGNTDDGNTDDGNTDDGNTDGGTEEETPIEVNITLDGDVSDWAGLHTITSKRENDTYTFYGVVTEDGLYVACDAYVAAFQASESGNWWDSPNLEYFVGPFTGDQNQRWVSCTNKEGGFRKEGNVTEAFVKYEAVEGSVTNHVIIESFIAKGQLDPNWFYSDGSIRVGMAFDTNNAQGGGYVVPTGTHERNNRTHVTAKGVYAMGDFFADDGEGFVEQGAQWSYLTATRDPNAAAEGWNTALNAQWNTAKAPFGNRAPGATNAWGTNDNPSDGTQTNAYLWVAREFTVEDLSALEGMDLYVNMFYDDTIVLYVNGTAVYTHTTGEPWNGGYTLYRLSEDISSLLVEGTNVIAASLHQHHGGYEFDLSLFASDSAVLDDLVK